MRFLRSKLVCIFILLLHIHDVHGQKETNNWYFGDSAGLSFNGATPIAITNNHISTEEGTASISDKSGNLIFYTDGFKVFNKNQVQMPNGNYLLGHFSTTQTLIVRQPGSARYYYIFTEGPNAASTGFRYTKIDMNLDNGLGDVDTSQKNVPLYYPSCEKIVGIQHCNNKDIWVVTREYDSNGFRAYLVTSAGVNPVPVISNAGLVVSADGSGRSAIGQLKASSDGKKLASASSYIINRFELFDFNNSTGVVSNAIVFPMIAAISDSGGAYGVEFSPDITKLYCTTQTIASGKIFQFDLCAGSDSAIAASGILITSLKESLAALQLGPDNKIYVARYKLPWLGVITSPNTLGIGCNYINNGIYLDGKISVFGLPNFVSNYFKSPPSPFTVSLNCLNAAFAAPTVNVTNCSGSSSAITSLSWNFNDPNTGIYNTSTITNPVHFFSDTGIYNVSLIINYACGADTLIQPIKVSAAANFNLITVSTNTDCDTANGILSVSAGSGSPPFQYLWNNGQTSSVATGLGVGTYSVTVIDSNGCKQTVAKGVISKSVVANAGQDVTIKAGTSAQLFATGGGSYNWSPSQGLSCLSCPNPTASPLLPTVYCVTVTDSNGCSNNDCVKVDIDCGNIFIPNAFSPNQDMENDLECVFGECIKTIHFVIYNRWGEQVFESSDQQICWDGTCKGIAEESAVFNYYLEAILTTSEKISKKGNISLIR